MTGKLMIGVFGVLVILYGSAWQWRLLGAVFAVWGFAAAVGGVLMRPRPPVRSRATTPIAEPASAAVGKAGKKAKGGSKGH